jgi:MYXO-CTERM domain-containing protein
VTFGGWHKSSSNPADYVSEFRIEWRDATTEVGRTPNLSPVPTSDYTPFNRTETVPAGANTARVVYAIQTFTDAGGGNTGEVFLDDMSFTVIPEPVTVAMAGLAGLALVAMRRRRR